jgi:hypothetical protein
MHRPLDTLEVGSGKTDPWILEVGVRANTDPWML